MALARFRVDALGLVVDPDSGHRERVPDALAANIIQLDAFTEPHAHGLISMLSAKNAGSLSHSITVLPCEQIAPF